MLGQLIVETENLSSWRINLRIDDDDIPNLWLVLWRGEERRGEERRGEVTASTVKLINTPLLYIYKT